MPYSPAPLIIQQTSASPTGTSSLTAVMMGFGDSTTLFKVTPQVTGRILFIVSGVCGNTTTGDGIQLQLRYGTGTAPVNGAAVSGTQAGLTMASPFITGVLTAPFSIQCFITGLAITAILGNGQTGPSTTYWLDVAVNAVTGGTASLTNVNLTALEL